jgi:nucleoside-diphosphate-sugar epimerase
MEGTNTSLRIRNDRMKSVLLVGGMGFVGSNTALKFSEEGYRVILFDIAKRNLSYLKEIKNWEFIQGDVNDCRQLLRTVKEHDIEGIVHFAVPRNSTGLMKPNLDACLTLLEVCRIEKLKFVFISSNLVYGYRPDSNPMVETDFIPGELIPGIAFNEYSATKAACEILTNMYHAVHGVDSVTCRLETVYGSGEGPKLSLQVYPQWILLSALHKIPIKLEKGGDFKANYTYVKDAAQGIFLAFTIRPLEHRIFNITGGGKISVNEVVEIVKRLVPGSVIQIGPGKMEIGIGRGHIHPLQEGAMLTSRAEKELGYSPTPLEQGLRETMRWYQKQPNLPKPCLQRKSSF